LLNGKQEVHENLENIRNTRVTHLERGRLKYVKISPGLRNENQDLENF
jgi:hypothetical protein